MAQIAATADAEVRLCQRVLARSAPQTLAVKQQVKCSAQHICTHLPFAHFILTCLVRMPVRAAPQTRAVKQQGVSACSHIPSQAYPLRISFLYKHDWCACLFALANDRGQAAFTIQTLFPPAHTHKGDFPDFSNNICASLLLKEILCRNLMVSYSLFF